jgi:hypothetical protein
MGTKIVNGTNQHGDNSQKSKPRTPTIEELIKMKKN